MKWVVSKSKVCEVGSLFQERKEPKIPRCIDPRKRKFQPNHSLDTVPLAQITTSGRGEEFSLPWGRNLCRQLEVNPSSCNVAGKVEMSHLIWWSHTKT